MAPLWMSGVESSTIFSCQAGIPVVSYFSWLFLLFVLNYNLHFVNNYGCRKCFATFLQFIWIVCGVTGLFIASYFMHSELVDWKRSLFSKARRENVLVKVCYFFHCFCTILTHSPSHVDSSRMGCHHHLHLHILCLHIQY